MARTLTRSRHRAAGSGWTASWRAAQTDLSRSRLQALIRDGRVPVNGAPARASQRAARRATACASSCPAAARPGARARGDPARDRVRGRRPARDRQARRAGRASRRRRDAAARWCTRCSTTTPRSRDVGGAGRPGIVHRLDKDTSGLMVVASTDARLPGAGRGDARAARCARVYRALVWGDPRADDGHDRGADRPRPARAQAHGGRDAAAAARRARTGACASASGRRPCSRCGSTPAAPTRSACTWRTSGTRWWAIRSTAGGPKKQLSLRQAQRSLAAALLECLPRQALHAAELAVRAPGHRGGAAASPRRCRRTSRRAARGAASRSGPRPVR